MQFYSSIFGPFESKKNSWKNLCLQICTQRMFWSKVKSFQGQSGLVKMPNGGARGISTDGGPPAWAVESCCLDGRVGLAKQQEKRVAHRLSKWPTDVEMDGTLSCRNFEKIENVPWPGLYFLDVEWAKVVEEWKMNALLNECSLSICGIADFKNKAFLESCGGFW